VTAFPPGGYALLQQIVVETAIKSNRSFSSDIEEARRRLEVWRKSRSLGKRIPGPLWALAAALARTHGVSPVSQRLGLDYNGLKRRAEATLTSGRSRLKPPPGFVELPLIGQLGNGPLFTVELARAEGARMTIRWRGKDGLDLVGLAEAFWRSGP
jgi:hypothetical protein